MEITKLSKQITLKNVISDKKDEIESLFKSGGRYNQDVNKKRCLLRDIDILKDILSSI